MGNVTPNEIGIAENEIRFEEIDENSEFFLQSPMYNVETTNVTFVRSQSFATENGNMHQIQKIPIDAFLNTFITSGSLALSNNAEKNQKTVRQRVIINYL